MALKKASRAAQYVMSAEFSFNYNDTVVDALTGTTKPFSDVSTITVEAINLPPGSRVLSGELITETAFNGTTYPIAVGDSGNTARYLASADRKAAATVPLVPTGFRNDSGLNIRLTIIPTGTHTAGKGFLRVEYVTDGRANEAVTA